MLNLASLNQRVNALTAKVNNIVPGGSQDLSQVLQEGNSAGAFDIDMNNQDILNGNDIQLVSINGIAVSEFQDTLEQTLINGNNAGTNDIDMNNQNILNCDNIQLVTINDIPIATFQDTLNQVLINGNTATGETASISLFGGVDDLVSSSLTNTQLVFSDTPHLSSMSAVEQQFSGVTAAAVLNEAGLSVVDTDVSSILSATSIAFTDTDSLTLNKSGLTTTADLTLDVGTNLILNGSLTETSAGGYSGNYLKLTINGVVYKLQLLVE
jgi:hypothetical protein